MKTISKLRTQAVCLFITGLCVLLLSACEWARKEDTQRENEPDSLGQLDDRFKLEDAEIAQERAAFEQNMHETAATYTKEMQALRAAVAELPAQKQPEGKQMVTQVEKKLNAFKEQLAEMKKAEDMRWTDYRKMVLGSSLDIKGHLNRAEELVEPVEAEAEAQ